MDNSCKLYFKTYNVSYTAHFDIVLGALRHSIAHFNG